VDRRLILDTDILLAHERGTIDRTTLDERLIVPDRRPRRECPGRYGGQIRSAVGRLRVGGLDSGMACTSLPFVIFCVHTVALMR
jgi:hypothetical protein